MNILTKLFFVVIIIVLTTSCSKNNNELFVGPWRGEFWFEGRTVPFNFEVASNGKGIPKVFLINGSERAELDSVYYRADSVVIDIDVYDALLIGKVEEGEVKGYFRKNQSGKQGIPFIAKKGPTHRFDIQDSSAARLATGKWSVVLTTEKDGKQTSRYTVGLFEQQDNKVTGTILTTTGDYRFLEGVVDGTDLKLSAFSGSNPTLIEAQFTDDTHLIGDFISPGGKVKLAAIKSDTAELPDAYSLTYLKDGFDRFSFSFPDLEGKNVSLSDEKYKGKVVVLTILGSWCPNCVDEAEFLAPWYKENRDRGVEIVGLSFERKDDLDFARKRLGAHIRKFDVQYDILFGGIADKKVVAEKLPELNTFLAFPTTFFIDKTGKVRKVHTGYDGPATGKYYEKFKREFNSEVNALIDEPAEKTSIKL
ncbi:MAG TPA: TlpA disulfide reductase family protein [Cyclobacteriaceae bacterium]|nr:TlpA disulfide reductase family protein [Cyclobacteriaceae bacterium]